jgi:hypothetical protein
VDTKHQRLDSMVVISSHIIGRIKIMLGLDVITAWFSDYIVHGTLTINGLYKRCEMAR